MAGRGQTPTPAIATIGPLSNQVWHNFFLGPGEILRCRANCVSAARIS
jgi:hypothetical protein